MARALDAEPDPGIVTPGITYSDNMIVTLGGQDVEMIYTGVQTHTDDMSIIRFPGERTIYGGGSQPGHGRAVGEYCAAGGGPAQVS